jgi:hypothetical protein
MAHSSISQAWNALRGGAEAFGRAAGWSS